jgi:hypothetical protein
VFVAGKGVVLKPERLRRQNHGFDVLYNDCAAGHLYGVRLVDEPQPKPRPRPTPSPLTRADGRPWLDNARWQEGWQRLMGR